MNVVSLVGNLATDVELKELGEERRVASFVLALDRPGRDGADFVRIAAWNRQAELCSRYLGRGELVGVEGRLRSRTWEEGGEKRSALEVVANRVEFLSGSERAGAGPRLAEAASR